MWIFAWQHLEKELRIIIFGPFSPKLVKIRSNFIFYYAWIDAAYLFVWAKNWKKTFLFNTFLFSNITEAHIPSSLRVDGFLQDNLTRLFAYHIRLQSQQSNNTKNGKKIPVNRSSSCFIILFVLSLTQNHQLENPRSANFQSYDFHCISLTGVDYGRTILINFVIQLP